MRLLAATILLGISLCSITTSAQAPYNMSLGFRFDQVQNPDIPLDGAEPWFNGYGNRAGTAQITRGAGVTTGDTLSNSFIGSGWIDPSLSAAIQNNRYFTFGTDGDPYPSLIDVKWMNAYHYRSATGPAWYQWEYSLDDFASPGVPIGDSVHFTDIDLSVPQYMDTHTILDMQVIGSISFRLYAWGATDTSGIFGLGPNPGGFSFSMGGIAAPGYSEMGFPVPGYPPATVHLYAIQGSPSFSQAINVTGEVMDSMTVSATPGYELSLDNMNFYPAFTLYPHPNSVSASATVYVRLNNSWPPGDANGAFGLHSLHLSDAQLNYTGTVYPAPAIPLTVDNNALEFGNTATGATVDKRLNLTTTTLSSNITVAAPASYQVSTDSLHFANTVTIARDTAENKQLPLFVRFSPNSSDLEFNDSITINADSSIVINVKGNTIPPVTTLGITSWNLNYFATPQRNAGPTNKVQQINNIKTILAGLRSDVYALQAVVNDSALAAVVATLPGYAYTISSYGSQSNPFDNFHPDSSAIARLAFIYNTSRLRNVRTTPLFGSDINTQADLNNPYYIWWGFGRYPYMLTADVDLSDSLGNITTKTIRFINIHAAENTGDSLADYDRKHNAAYMLDTLIRQHYSGDNIILLGDFKDDLNRTTIPRLDSISPYSPLLDDSTTFSFPTKVLSQQRQRSTTNLPGVRQNMIVSNTMSALYLPSSALVLSQVASQVPAYDTSTAGNYPLFAGFSFAPPSAPLPLTLLDLTAVRQDAQARLLWKTSNESNVARFVIQRGSDSKTFVTIGTVTAKGNSSATTNYSFDDTQPFTGANYYRLKMVDQDEKFVYSKTVVLSFGSPKLDISPNPAHGTANLYIGNAGEAFYIQVFDGSGRQTRQFRTAPGDTVFPIDLSGLSKGIYTVKLTSATSTVTQQLIVQ